ncbi:MAG: 1-acyl-sn-glycerol-3-phosphate acyltransferase [Acidobacteriota bacterium]
MTGEGDTSLQQRHGSIGSERTVFPVGASRVLLRLLGWRIEGAEIAASKTVVITANHTSNWDVLFGLLLASACGIRGHAVAKASLCRGVLAPFTRRFGFIPVDRHVSTGFVEQVVAVFAATDRLHLAFAPDGTRGHAPYWRTGFYQVACQARVPIVLMYFDYPRKVCGFGPALMPTGDLEADLVPIRAFYAHKRGLYPEKEGPIRVRPQSDGKNGGPREAAAGSRPERS